MSNLYERGGNFGNFTKEGVQSELGKALKVPLTEQIKQVGDVVFSLVITDIQDQQENASNLIALRTVIDSPFQPDLDTLIKAREGIINIVRHIRIAENLNVFLHGINPDVKNIIEDPTGSNEYLPIGNNIEKIGSVFKKAGISLDKPWNEGKRMGDKKFFEPFSLPDIPLLYYSRDLIENISTLSLTAGKKGLEMELPTRVQGLMAHYQYSVRSQIPKIFLKGTFELPDAPNK